MDMNVILMATVATVVYALSGLFKSLPKGENPDGMKFMATVVYGLFVGLFLGVMGVEINEQNITFALATYAGFLVISENIVKAIYRYIGKYLDGR